jgi:hypothetical protein
MYHALVFMHKKLLEKFNKQKEDAKIKMIDYRLQDQYRNNQFEH